MLRSPTWCVRLPSTGFRLEATAADAKVHELYCSMAIHYSLPGQSITVHAYCRVLVPAFAHTDHLHFSPYAAVNKEYFSHSTCTSSQLL